jgi:hypothetical protein
VKGSRRIRLLEERMRRSVRRREKDHATRVGRDTFDDGRSGGRRGRPDEEHSADTLQSGVERFRRSQIARHGLGGRWQSRRRGSARKRADGHTRTQQLGDHQSPDTPGRSGHEDRIHFGSHY